MFMPVAVSMAQLVAYAVVIFLFAAEVLVKAARSRGSTGDRRRSASTVGIALQSAAFFFVGFGSVHPIRPPLSAASIAGTAVVVLLGGAAVALFFLAARTMGDNWSLVARTRGDHQLVRAGPFAVVRHPIYLAMLLLLICTAAGLGHWTHLLVALPVFAVGTLNRIRLEEALLREQFGDDHRRYTQEVPALFPRLR